MLCGLRFGFFRHGVGRGSNSKHWCSDSAEETANITAGLVHNMPPDGIDGQYSLCFVWRCPDPDPTPGGWGFKNNTRILNPSGQKPQPLKFATNLGAQNSSNFHTCIFLGFGLALARHSVEQKDPRPKRLSSSPFFYFYCEVMNLSKMQGYAEARPISPSKEKIKISAFFFLSKFPMFHELPISFRSLRSSESLGVSARSRVPLHSELTPPDPKS